MTEICENQLQINETIDLNHKGITSNKFQVDICEFFFLVDDNCGRSVCNFIQKMHLEFVQGELNPLKLSPPIYLNIDVRYQNSSFFTSFSMHSFKF